MFDGVNVGVGVFVFVAVFEGVNVDVADGVGVFVFVDVAVGPKGIVKLPLTGAGIGSVTPLFSFHTKAGWNAVVISV